MACDGSLLPIWRRPWREQLRHSMRWLPFALIGMLVAFWTLSQYVIVGPNRTGSLRSAPILVIVKNGVIPPKSALVAFTPRGHRYFTEYPYWVKRLEGVPGDVVTYRHGNFYINERLVTTTKPVAKDGRPLVPSRTGVLPECMYFLSTEHPDGYDSRYADIGWVQCDQILGRAYAVP